MLSDKNQFQPIIFLYFILSLICFANADVLISADNPLINYYGRFDFSSTGSAKFNWSGSTIEAAFSGTSIGIELSDGNADYIAEIDGKYYSTIKTVSGTVKYNISSTLSDAAHTIRIVQKSEQHWNTAEFKGFYLENGKLLSDPPQKPAKKIEFIGDSFTAGYGNESPSGNCSSDQLRTYTNTNMSFGKLVSDAFHAQCIALGWSGAGIVRNYGDSKKKSDDPYPVYYKNTLGAIDGNWDFSKFIPDLVVICLGTNDFSTTPHPDDTMYSNGYHSLISTVRSNYSSAPILCVSTHTGPMDNILKKIVSDQKTVYNHDLVYYAEFPQTLAYSGCHGHPSLSDDTLIAESLVNSIRTSAGWDTALITFAKHNKQIIAKQCGFSTLFVNSGILIGIEGSANQAEFSITDLRGNLIHENVINGKQPYLWNTSGISSGIYLISNRGSGFTKSVIVKR